MDYESHDIPIHILATSENMHDIETEFNNLLIDKTIELARQQSIDSAKNQFIAKTAIQYFDVIKSLEDPKNEYNDKTLAEKAFNFIRSSLEGTMKSVHFGMGAYSIHGFENMMVYKLGWVGKGDHQVLATVTGNRISNDYFAISGHKERDWYTPVPNRDNSKKEKTDA